MQQGCSEPSQSSWHDESTANNACTIDSDQDSSAACEAPQNETIKRQSAKLFEWIQEKGGHIHGIKITGIQGSGRGLVASQLILEDTDVLTLPVDLVVSSQLALQTPLGKSLMEYAKKMKLVHIDLDGLLLTSWLLHETARENSTWSTYIESLPQEYPGSALFFSEEQCSAHSCSQGLPLESYLIAARESLGREFDIFRQLSPAESARITWDRYIWARMVSFSRTFGVPRSRLLVDLIMSKGIESSDLAPKRLVASESGTQAQNSDDASIFAPLADMINHGHGKALNCKWEYTSKGLVIRATKPIKVGEQLFIDYGDKDNGIFLAHYGFVLAGNHKDKLTLQLRLNSTDSSKDANISLPVEASKPSAHDEFIQILKICRNHAKALSNEGASSETIEKTALTSLVDALDKSTTWDVEMQPVSCPTTCIEYRRNLNELVNTWRAFALCAIAFMESSSIANCSKLTTRRFELHARLYFGNWLRTDGRQFAQSHELLLEAEYYGNVRYLDLLFDADDL